MEWMPPPDGIAMCQSDIRQNVTDLGADKGSRYNAD